MSALAAHVAPRSVSPERYRGKTDAVKARLVRAEVQLISRFLRQGLNSVCWHCHACSEGRVTIYCTTVHTTSGRGELTTTKGTCSTPGCLDWED